MEKAEGKRFDFFKKVIQTSDLKSEAVKQDMKSTEARIGLVKLGVGDEKSLKYIIIS